MNCKKCGKELRAGAKFCSGCGTAVEVENQQSIQPPAEIKKGKLIIYGYTQWFAVKPSVDVLKNGVKIAEVMPAGVTEIDIDSDCTITFKCSFRTAVIQVKADAHQEIQLAFDRFTGDLLATCKEGSASSTKVGFNSNTSVTIGSGKPKDKEIAGLLAILLGGFGAHKFYMGRHGQAILYLLLCWTYVPAIVGLIEGIIYLVESNEKFNSRCR